jgi:sugar transferase (PEP-CTERM/EpsH1 system associated)
MRLLFVSQRVPYPPNRGDKIATYHQIRHLTRKHDVVVACLAENREDLENVKELAPMVASVDAVPLSPQRARIRALGCLASSVPLTVAYFNEPELHRRVADLMARRAIDAVIVYSSGVAQFVERYQEVPRIMHFGDLDSLKWEQYASKSHPPMRWVYQSEYRRMLDYECRLANRFSHSVVHTRSELQDFQRLIPGAPVSCIGNGVDLNYFQPMGLARKTNSLIFTGVMDYFPNVEGVVWFCREVFPIIKVKIPNVSFVICGARPNAAVRRLGRMPGVVVTGKVPDIRTYLDRASVGVVPLRIARGIQNKLLEGMAMGLPIVSTTVAFLGVEAIESRDLLVADTAPDFAAAVVRLLKEEELRREMGRSARTVMEANYNWDTQLGQLDRVLDIVLTRSPTGQGSADAPRVR